VRNKSHNGSTGEQRALCYWQNNIVRQKHVPIHHIEIVSTTYFEFIFSDNITANRNYFINIFYITLTSIKHKCINIVLYIDPLK
jgi:hypothetical protein